MECESMEKKYKRFCPTCKKVLEEWKCPVCKVKTRRLNMTRRMDAIIPEGDSFFSEYCREFAGAGANE